jgi:formylglycine-generating enzyme required for sulfatase activity
VTPHALADELELVRIPAGRFEMGSPEAEAGRWNAEGPRRRVWVESFWLGRVPITQAQWWAAARLPRVDRALDPDPSRFEGARLPVENVTWLDAVEFCLRVSLASGRAFRLPSEAEWEYACRAGGESAFECGDVLAEDRANFWSEHPRGGTTPVGAYPANAFGLHDMHGNVFEWCADGWHFDYRGAPCDAKPWLEGSYPNYRPLRGGAWCTLARGCRSAYRTAAHQNRDHRINANGFRVAVCLAGG